MGKKAGVRTSNHTVLCDCTAERVALILNHMLKLSDNPFNLFYGKENSQYLNRPVEGQEEVSSPLNTCLALNGIILCPGH